MTNPDGRNFSSGEIFVGQNFRHFSKNSSLSPDKVSSDKVRIQNISQEWYKTFLSNSIGCKVTEVTNLCYISKISSKIFGSHQVLKLVIIQTAALTLREVSYNWRPKITFLISFIILITIGKLLKKNNTFY